MSQIVGMKGKETEKVEYQYKNVLFKYCNTIKTYVT